MKFLKAVLVVILLGLASLILIGVFVPEIDDEVELQINEPIVTVFAAMMTTNAMPEWVDDLQSVERTGGILAMPGSTFDLHFKGVETEVIYKMEVLEMVPMKSVRVHIYNDMLDVEMSINFEADALATDMTVFTQVKGQGLLTRSMLPLMKGVVMDEIEQNFENFKQLQEE